MRHNCIPRALMSCSQYYPWPKEMSLPGDCVYVGIKPGRIKALLGYVEGRGEEGRITVWGLGKEWYPSLKGNPDSIP